MSERTQINGKWVCGCPYCGIPPRLDQHFDSEGERYGWSFYCRRCHFDFKIRERYGNLVSAWNRRFP